jgi:hypothetical protein
MAMEIGGGITIRVSLRALDGYIGTVATGSLQGYDSTAYYAYDGRSMPITIAPVRRLLTFRRR